MRHPTIRQFYAACIRLHKTVVQLNRPILHSELVELGSEAFKRFKPEGAGEAKRLFVFVEHFVDLWCYARGEDRIRYVSTLYIPKGRWSMAKVPIDHRAQTVAATIAPTLDQFAKILTTRTQHAHASWRTT